MSDEKLELIEIVSSGQIKAVRELMDKKNSGALKLDLNERDGEGNLAAVIAAKRNDLEMLELLVSNGARIDLADSYGRTVEGWARKYKNEEMLQFIMSKSAQKKSPVDISSTLASTQNGNSYANNTSIKVGGGK
jgi:ankyrin repeat protein